MKNVILLLGSNLGEVENNLSRAISLLEKRIGKVIKKSKIIKTLPVEFDSSNIFCNIAVNFETALSPILLLREIKKIEKEMGRVSDSRDFGEYRDRIIDIDIVCYDGIHFISKDLELPHQKHLHQREFSKELLKELEYNLI